MTKEATKEWKLIIFFISIFSVLAYFITAGHARWLRLLFFALAIIIGIVACVAYTIVESAIETRKDEKEKKRQEAENERSRKIMEKLREKEEKEKK